MCAKRLVLLGCNEIAPFQISWCHMDVSKNSWLVLITSSKLIFKTVMRMDTKSNHFCLVDVNYCTYKVILSSFYYFKWIWLNWWCNTHLVCKCHPIKIFLTENFWMHNILWRVEYNETIRIIVKRYECV